MSRSQCLLTTRMALYRVFVSPADRPELARQLLLRPRWQPPAPSHNALGGVAIRCFSSSTHRMFVRRGPRGRLSSDAAAAEQLDKDDLGYDPRYTTKESVARSGRDRLPRDLEIKDPRIMVQENGVIEGPLSTRHVLSRLQPEESLRMVRPYLPAREGGPETYALCTIVDKKAEYEKERALKEQKKKSGVGAEVKTKEMEVSWNISGGDLDTKMRQIAGFIAKGMRVHIAFGKKRKGKTVTAPDAEALVADVKARIVEAGGKDTKKPDGEMGATYRLYVEKK